MQYRTLNSRDPWIPVENSLKGTMANNHRFSLKSNITDIKNLLSADEGTFQMIVDRSSLGSLRAAASQASQLAEEQEKRYKIMAASSLFAGLGYAAKDCYYPRPNNKEALVSEVAAREKKRDAAMASVMQSAKTETEDKKSVISYGSVAQSSC